MLRVIHKGIEDKPENFGYPHYDDKVRFHLLFINIMINFFI